MKTEKTQFEKNYELLQESLKIFDINDFYDISLDGYKRVKLQGRYKSELAKKIRDMNEFESSISSNGFVEFYHKEHNLNITLT